MCDFCAIIFRSNFCFELKKVTYKITDKINPIHLLILAFFKSKRSKTTITFFLPNFCHFCQHKTDSNGVQVPPGDVFANNYGREHRKPSYQVRYNMRLPPYKEILVNNDQYIQGTPCL